MISGNLLYFFKHKKLVLTSFNKEINNGFVKDKYDRLTVSPVNVDFQGQTIQTEYVLLMTISIMFQPNNENLQRKTH